MSTGPVEYIIVGFPKADFTGSIAAELVALVDQGLIRVLDLVVVAKSEDGDVALLEIDEHANLAVFLELDADIGGILGEADVAYAAEALEPGSAAAMLLVEDLWAAPLANAIRASGGVFLEGGRIPAELFQAAEDSLASAG